MMTAEKRSLSLNKREFPWLGDGSSTPTEQDVRVGLLLLHTQEGSEDLLKLIIESQVLSGVSTPSNN